MLTNENLCFKEEDSTSKNDVLDKISQKLVDLKYIKSKSALFDAFIEREKEFSTGMGESIAIPHAEINGIKDALIVVVRVKDIEWNSLDNKPVKTVLAIIVPKGKRGDHLLILAELSKKLMDKKFSKQIRSSSLKEVEKIINSIKIDNGDSKSKVEERDFNKKFIIGITACPTGIAHTFMAQQKLINEAKRRGFISKIETQGSEGIKDKLTIKDIELADAVVIATGIALEEMNRFNGYEDKIHSSDLTKVIKNSKDVVERALEIGESFNGKDTLLKKDSSKKDETSLNFVEKKSKWETAMGHVMTGISAMLPILLIAGLLMAIGNIGALHWTLPNHNSIGDSSYASSSNVWVDLMYYINQIGSIIMKFMYPVFAMYLSYSIGGKLALIPGFMGGVMAAGLETNFIAGGASSPIYSSDLLNWAYHGQFIASAFFGALFIGFFIGYFTKFLNKKIQFSPNIITLKTMLIIPLILSVTVFIIMAFAINPLFGFMNLQVQNVFKAAGASGKFIYGSSIAIGTALDLGGPFNKAAGAISNGMNTDAFTALTDALSSGDVSLIADAVNQIQVFNITSRTLSIIIPPIGIGTAALIGNKVTQREIFTKEEEQLGGQAAFLGLIGISEGGIPMMLKFPLIIIGADVIGSVVGSSVAMIFGSIQTLPLPAIWGWGLVGTTTQGAVAYGIHGIGEQIFGYIIGLVVGVSVVATIIISTLLVKDIKENNALKVSKISKFNTLNDQIKNDESSSEQLIKTTTLLDRKINMSKNSIKKIIKFYEEKFNEFDCDKNMNFEKKTDQEVKDQKVIFSKLKVMFGKEIKKVSKFNYKTMRNDQKNRVINSKIQFLKEDNIQGEKIDKLNNKILKNENDNVELEKLIIEENKKINLYILREIDSLERLTKIMETYEK